ncbi:MAG: hypothetical protein IPL23_05165 [Saprospiraceae bacterium]|nr:hypothetical protein [Saprospiraceae bacterium]
MLRIEIPHFAFEEIAYTIRTLLNCINVREEVDMVAFEGNKTTFYFSDKYFSIENHFFQEGGSPETWYKMANIPTQIKYFKPTFCEESLLVLFGEAIETKETSGIKIKADLIATAFFMLSRWEEYAEKRKDEHGRFLAEAALSVKHNFIQIPIVNQIASYLREIFTWLGYECPEQSTGQMTMTFDIDYVYKWKSMKNLGGAILRNGLNFSQSFGDLRSFAQSKNDKSLDPYFSFDFILEALSNRQQKAVFYFKSEIEQHIFDDTDYELQDANIQLIIQNILKEGHQIALHPSYASFHKPSLLAKEKNKMHNTLHGKPLVKVRQHFLRIQFPETFHLLQNEGFTEDSSSMYTHFSGFRNGVANRFNVFDFLSRKELQISILPLISMMSVSRSIPLAGVVSEMIELSRKVQKYHGEANLLWHNSDLDTSEKKEAFISVLDAI